MRNELRGLLNAMDREIGILESLSTHLSSKMNAISERSFEEMVDIERRIEELLTELQRAEEEREKATERFALGLDLPKSVRASDLLPHLRGQEKEELILRIARMLRVTNEIQFLRDGIKEMLELELAYSTAMMHLFYGGKTFGFYDRDGKDMETEEARRSWSG